MSVFRLTFIWILMFSALAQAASTDVTQDYPELKKFVFEEPKSQFRFGFGFNPVGVLQNRMFLALNVFELHWISRHVDLELFTAQIGFGFAKESYAGSRHFSFRSSPRVKVLDFFSIGPLVGYEFVSFPNVGAKLTKNSFATPAFEPFSSAGFIYGVAASETVSLKENYIIMLHQAVYQQTYSTTKSPDGWDYFYEQIEIQNDPEKKAIQTSFVFLLGASLLF